MNPYVEGLPFRLQFWVYMFPYIVLFFPSQAASLSLLLVDLKLAMEFESFTVEDKPGEQWIRLRGKYGEKEDIKIEVTMFDGAVQAPKAGDSDKEDDMKLHISLIVDVSKGEKCDNVLEFICSAWPDSLEIQKVFMLKRDRMAVKPFVGPNFK